MQIRFTPKNTSECLVLSLEGRGMVALKAKESLDLSEEEWAKLSQRATIKARLKAHTLRVVRGTQTGVVPSEDQDLPAQLEGEFADADVMQEWTSWHWQKAQRFLDQCEDAATVRFLEKLDNRPSVSKRIALRLEELADEAESKDNE